MLENNTIDLAIINSIDNEFNKDIYKALKPGGYLFGIDKPHKSHNSVCDIEDIGFEIKDSISYFFAENEEVKQYTICLAMKPLSEKNFAENVMRWGTGGLNIDKCRIGNEKISVHNAPKGTFAGGEPERGSETIYREHEGRYPANFIISEDVAPVLDKQSGYSKSSPFKAKGTIEAINSNLGIKNRKGSNHNDEGGASRFFYNAKSYKDLLKYITILGLPPKESKVLFIGFDNADEIIEEINKESNVKYEAITIGGSK